VEEKINEFEAKSRPKDRNVRLVYRDIKKCIMSYQPTSKFLEVESVNKHVD
jgi:hypothetical protein